MGIFIMWTRGHPRPCQPQWALYHTQSLLYRNANKGMEEELAKEIGYINACSQLTDVQQRQRSFIGGGDTGRQREPKLPSERNKHFDTRSIKQDHDMGSVFELDPITDVMTPGAFILGLYPINLGNYTVESGISFSTPFLAYVYTIVMEATGIKDTASILNMLSKTSIANLWNDGNIHIQLLSTCTSARRRSSPSSVTHEIANVGAPAVYTFPNDTAITPMNFPNDFDMTSASLSFSPPRITINGTDGSNLGLPYMGAAAKMRDMTVLDVRNTTVVSSLDPTYKPLQANYMFTLPPMSRVNNTTYNPTEIPRLYIQMAFASRLIDAYTYQSRISLSDAEGVAWFPTWDGSLADGTYVPAGSYKFRVNTLHIFGDESVESDWDVAETVPFATAYNLS
ncbi:hypothetical protein F5Y16DRAFT_405823 [Xylariaceae sp. FL0255]|nr:hypothetical protein F5Y16DRAFT_405823 [Xylariaceae sp. FL0255]